MTRSEVLIIALERGLVSWLVVYYWLMGFFYWSYARLKLLSFFSLILCNKKRHHTLLSEWGGE